MSNYIDLLAAHFDINPIEWWQSHAEQLHLLGQAAKHMLVVQEGEPLIMSKKIVYLSELIVTVFADMTLFSLYILTVISSLK